MVQKVSWYLSLSIDPDVQRIFLEHDPVHCSIDGQKLPKVTQLIRGIRETILYVLMQGPCAIQVIIANRACLDTYSLAISCCVLFQRRRFSEFNETPCPNRLETF